MPIALELAIACKPTDSLGEFLTFERWPESGAYLDQDANMIDEMRLAVQVHGLYRKLPEGEKRPPWTLEQGRLVAWIESDGE